MTDTIPDGSAALSPSQLEHMRKLRRILRFLATDERIEHMLDRILVFGSAEVGKACPGDIDAYFDFSDDRSGNQHPSAVKRSGLLLSLAAQFYGSFDPFVRVGKILYARSDNCNGWVYANNAAAIRKAGEAGRTPMEVWHEIKARPPELGGAPAPAPEAAIEPAMPGP